MVMSEERHNSNDLIEDEYKGKKAVILFSGGIDSSYLVLKTADEFEKVILLTYRVPTMVNVAATRKVADKLRDLIGHDKIEHTIVDIRGFIKE